MDTIWNVPKEGGMCHSLGVSCDAIMLLACEVDVLRLETGENFLDKGKVGIGCAMFDQHQWLPFRVDPRAVERMTGDDANIGRQVFLKSSDLRCFAGCLTADDSSQLGG
jgi:hypothetical protein